MKKLNKTQALKALTSGKDIYLCPCKLRFGGPWHPEYLLNQSGWNEWITKAAGYVGNPTLWKGNPVNTAWSLMYNNWAFYNTSAEMGSYAHYYVK
jgi:hypothetical protein